MASASTSSLAGRVSISSENGLFERAAVVQAPLGVDQGKGELLFKDAFGLEVVEEGVLEGVVRHGLTSKMLLLPEDDLAA